jgi:DNA-binding response OmpR family regulator
MILVVDDEPSIAQAIGMLLEAHGYSVAIANSCDEALSLVSEHRPRLILSDVNMPCRSGLDMIRELRASHEADEVPVIFVSAMTRPQDIQAGLNAGAREYITKPFSPQRLLSSVQSCMSQAN